jgi:hypothetical protein
LTAVNSLEWPESRFPADVQSTPFHPAARLAEFTFGLGPRRRFKHRAVQLDRVVDLLRCNNWPPVARIDAGIAA